MKYLGFLSIILLIMSCNSTSEVKSSQADYEKSIDSLLSLMTLEEKINMIHASSSFTSGGVERLGIKELVMSDGPHGVRHEHGRDWTPDNITTDSVSYLPTGIALASTWNRDLGYKYGQVLGNEAKARGKDVILGPGINIIRSPLCGRNFEYLSEDPFLTSEMAIGYIKGVQEQEISACAKHFVANNQETERSGVNVTLSDRALHEIYLPAFKASVEKAGVYSVMGAYNKIWDDYCSHNDKLVNEILKGDFGFTGFLVSDWGAVHNTKKALLYGTDIEMGTDLVIGPKYNEFFLGDSAMAMVERGEVSESYVDDKVRRILRVMFKTNHFSTKTPGKRNTAEHHQLALNVAEEGIVLLKNEEFLPIDKSEKMRIAVIGDNATRKHAEEGGSSQVKTLYEITPLEGIKNIAGENVEIVYARGYEPTRAYTLDKHLMEEAVKLAKTADKVIFVGGWIHNFDAAEWGKDAFDSEGLDKKDIKLLFGQETVINEIAKVNPNLAVVIMGGSNVEMANWQGNAKAVLQAWYPGMEGGKALAEIIFGDINPSGKLPMTFANSHLDYPAHKIGEFPGADMSVEYKEGIMVGYRYFATENVEPLYPFGFGLSYTTFDFANLNVQKDAQTIEVTLDIKNSGEFDGKEVIQCYVSKPESDFIRPAIELKGFTKELIQKGETKSITLSIPVESLKIYDEANADWLLEQGKYLIKVGSSSVDLPLEAEIEI